MDIKNITENLIKRYKTHNPLELAELMDIVVITQRLGKIKGAYKYIKKNRVIFLNQDLDYYDTLVVCAHELGHAVLHKKINCTFLKHYTLYSAEKIERQANLFCSYLLIPDKALTQYKDCSANYIASTFNVPVEYLYLRQM